MIKHRLYNKGRNALIRITAVITLAFGILLSVAVIFIAVLLTLRSSDFDLARLIIADLVLFIIALAIFLFFLGLYEFFQSIPQVEKEIDELEEELEEHHVISPSATPTTPIASPHPPSPLTIPKRDSQNPALPVSDDLKNTPDSTVKE